MTKNITASYVSGYRDCRGCREHSVNLALDRITENENEVESLLCRINTNKSSGPDGIGNWILKHCAKPLSFPYSKLFNK